MICSIFSELLYKLCLGHIPCRGSHWGSYSVEIEWRNFHLSHLSCEGKVFVISSLKLLKLLTDLSN